MAEGPAPLPTFVIQEVPTSGAGFQTNYLLPRHQLPESFLADHFTSLYDSDTKMAESKIASSEIDEVKRSRRRTASGRSMQDQICIELKRRITAGNYEVGSFLPSIRVLAREFHSSITPVRLAIDQLVDAGMLKSRHGSGVVVVSTLGNIESGARKPTIEVITTVTDRMGGGSPSARSHRLMAVQEYLLWSLTAREDIRLSLATVRSNHAESLVLSRLKDALNESPEVLVLPIAEVVSSATIEALRRLQAQGTKIVYNAARYWVEDFDRVVSDFEQGQYLLTKKLLDLGFRRIVRFSAGHTVYHHEAEKQKGFARAMSEAGWGSGEITDFTVDKKLSQYPEQHVIELLAILPDLLARTKPDAICSYADVTTPLMKTSLALLGREELEVTGYDGAWNEMDWPGELGGLYAVNKRRIDDGPAPLSVDTHLPEVGVALAELALARVLGQAEPGPQLKKIPQTLLVP